MNGVGLVSAAVVGGISYLLMRKEKMLVQGAVKRTQIMQMTEHKILKR